MTLAAAEPHCKDEPGGGAARPVKPRLVEISRGDAVAGTVPQFVTGKARRQLSLRREQKLSGIRQSPSCPWRIHEFRLTVRPPAMP